jgi:hypothetical protein
MLKWAPMLIISDEAARKMRHPSIEVVCRQRNLTSHSSAALGLRTNAGRHICGQYDQKMEARPLVPPLMEQGRCETCLHRINFELVVAVSEGRCNWEIAVVLTLRGRLRLNG